MVGRGLRGRPQDRLFELELFRHATTGTLTEIVGSSRLDDDRIVRQDFYTPAELDEQYDAVPGDFKPRFDAYTDGVNAWIATCSSARATCPPSTRPPGRRSTPWTMHDSVAIGVYLARTIATNADPEGLELANMRIAQLGGAQGAQRLVPLRTPRRADHDPAGEGAFPRSRAARASRSARR